MSANTIPEQDELDFGQDLDLDRDTDSREADDPEKLADESEDQGIGDVDARAIKDKGRDIEDDGYSERVQKRIAKEVARRKSEEDQRRVAEERIALLEQRLASLSKGLEERDAKAQEFHAKTEEERAQALYEAAKSRHRKAVEEADVDAQTKALDEILEARERLREVRSASKAPPRPVEPSPYPQSPQQASAPVLPAGTREWLSKNTWFTDQKALADPKLASRARMAEAIDQALQVEGYSPHDPDMYEELDKRLDAVLGSRKGGSGKGGNGKDSKSQSQQSQASYQPSVAGASYDGGGNAAPGERRLTKEDLETMRQYGFDPNKASDRKAWLKYSED